MIILCPKYSTKKIGNVIYAARNEAAEKFPGKKTWKPFVRVRITRKPIVKIVVNGWPRVLCGRDSHAPL